MEIEAEIKKWGNSLALRLSGAMAEVPDFSVGTKVCVSISKDGLVIKKAVKESKKLNLPYSEKSLLRGLNPETVHADELAILSEAESGS
ncbi:hypothetical protein [Endozoicomonas sp. 4G]|uniref:AbrB/MazE/SpoVT family DNA-binding domain-containing protein n=1 Tax=Endozoicomonas sp. 4G TaxID=2872754 RepID=UPI00207904CD|nr:hypothetical protein [Endozoicomonas sp. 4G]